MSHQFSVGQRVKVIGLRDPPETWECVAYPWGTVVAIENRWGKDLYRVEYEGHQFAPYALLVPPENLLDYFTAICQDAIDDTTMEVEK